MASSTDPITNVFILAAKENLRQSQYTKKLLVCTQRGYDGDLYESSWRSKGKRYLGYEKDPSSPYIISDALVIRDDEPVPNGFSGVFLTDDTNEKALKKHVLCIKKEAKNNARKGVSEFCLINQSKGEKAGPNFCTISHEINEMNITFCVEVTQRPPNVHTPPHQANRVNEMPLQRPRNTDEITSDQSSTAAPFKSAVSGIEGIPFTINPKYNVDHRVNDPIMSSIQILTADDIMRKFQHDFSLEQETVRNS